MSSIDKTLILILLVTAPCFGQLPTQNEIDSQMDSILSNLRDSILVASKSKPFWETSKNNTVSLSISKWDTSVFHSWSEPIDNFFSRDDYHFFIDQIRVLKNKKWNKKKFSTLGLKIYKKGDAGNVWGFTMPLFTLDRQSFIIQFGYYCGNLCAYDCTYIYRKEAGKWRVWKKTNCVVS